VSYRLDPDDYSPDPPERPEGPPCEECNGRGFFPNLARIIVRQGFTSDYAHNQSMCECCGGSGVEPVE
jgi:DnaJ-class molecular chaperone